MACCEARQRAVVGRCTGDGQAMAAHPAGPVACALRPHPGLPKGEARLQDLQRAPAQLGECGDLAAHRRPLQRCEQDVLSCSAQQRMVLHASVWRGCCACERLQAHDLALWQLLCRLLGYARFSWAGHGSQPGLATMLTSGCVWTAWHSWPCRRPDAQVACQRSGAGWRLLDRPAPLQRA